SHASFLSISTRNLLVNWYRHFVAIARLASRVVRWWVGYKSSSYRGKYAPEGWPAQQYRQDVLPSNCVRRYVARYAHLFALELTRAPMYREPTHRSSAASPRS